MKISMPAFLPLLLLSAAAAAHPVEVRNESPQAPPRTVRLLPEWSAGGEDGGVIFGMMIDSLADPDGNVYLLDSQLCHVEVFSPTGEHLRTISREGEGPGEVSSPRSVVIMPAGDLGILELQPAHFVVMGLDGTPCKSPTWGGDEAQTGWVFGNRAVCRGGNLLVAAMHSGARIDGRQTRTQYLASLSSSGEEIVRYHQRKITFDFTNPRIVESDILPNFLLTNAVGPDGRIYMPRERNSYSIAVFEPDGTAVRVIERDFSPPKRTDGELRRLNAVIDAWTAGMGDIPRDLEKIEPVITDLQVDDEGVLWVQHSRSGKELPEGVLFRYDTFSPDGAWLGEVHVEADGDPVYDGVKFLGGGRALLIRGYVLARWASLGADTADFGEEEAAAMEVVYCRVVEES